MPARRYPGSLERRGDTFRVYLSVGGERHRFTVPTTDRRVAERAARERARELEALHARKAAGLPDGVRMSALLELFRAQEMPTLAPGAQRSYDNSLKPIESYFVDQLGDPSVQTIQARHITAFLTWRRTHRFDTQETLAAKRGKPAPAKKPKAPPAPLSGRTLAKDRAVLHRLFAIADRLEYRDGNPVARVATPKYDGRDAVILSSDEYERLLAECAGRPMLALYVLTLGETGARCRSEALRLQWQDVDFAGGFLWIASGRDGHRTKSGKGRWVPMTPRLTEAMREHFAAYRMAAYGPPEKRERTPWVFHHTTTRTDAKPGQRMGSLRHAIVAAVARAKLPAGFVQHDLRHRRVTTWLGDGKSAALVQEAMGHSDLRTTMGYKHLSREHLRGLVATSPAPAAAPPAPAAPSAPAEQAS